uniref:Uncharacterized protein n=1 Tax=Moniliophthora roreri TaxID=221103 RepID=A0A0W0F7Z0_MONRR
MTYRAQDRKSSYMEVNQQKGKHTHIQGWSRTSGYVEGLFDPATLCTGSKT